MPDGYDPARSRIAEDTLADFLRYFFLKVYIY